jgi:prevent-host-death family protein
MKKKSIGAFKAKTHFSELLAAVSFGEEFAITRHGKKVAMLVPFVEQEKSASIDGAIRAIKKLRTGITLGKNLSIKQMRAEGRK